MLLPNADFPDNGVGSLACAPIAWLKRIPPLDELESARSDFNADMWIENNVRTPA